MFLKLLYSAVVKGNNTFPLVYQVSAPNFVPENVVPGNAETAGNVVANDGQVWLLNFKDQFGN